MHDHPHLIIDRDGLRTCVCDCHHCRDDHGRKICPHDRRTERR